MTKTYVDIHAIQTVPPSNLNRDDTGSPKTAIFGGARRARVSSQAWKRAVRKDFSDFLDQNKLGERTLFLAERIAEEVRNLNPELADTALDLSVDALKAAGIKAKKSAVKVGGDETVERAQTDYLIFASRPQIQAMAKLIADSPDTKLTKKEAKQALTEGVSIDVALFGRMIADDPGLNVDACCQVSHALSVHAVDTEFDYFTAVDDNAEAGNAGAGMIGTVEFNSSTLYRYATVNAHELANVLGSPAAAAEATSAFIRSFVTSMPTGKQNTFANRTLPEFVLVTIREDQPINLVGAFEDPVEITSGRSVKAAELLVQQEQEIQEAYGSKPVAEFAIAVKDCKEALTDHPEITSCPLDELVSNVSSLVASRNQG
ncbi:type I-E CRISPR-associated protein Cas7/Cse4/CasC [Propionimicrobium lymphophilum]|uniref:CRISPR-associated protein cas7/cse4/casc, subtype I-e n=1 Tax=Propionimicrobium lymphophilum ACS-093-V-SCH5 TaxID=883161 RepID=S2VZ04_9ACTN|nr:type I-E CRISPR-associated protein Cas7/Cse4/CasC [Propionimicrobium lymphophilum]EPD32728.1 CRISPR-associated protein cas7/cse4/casc, subtype I-e [Propionimicrobium lymphophilum ACS-093-V-SCH5]MDK7709272.1 type I-E CRISPR-associated protein Cas7/Cse4/CasC [Propionimicrobium lymphophilum]MDK7733260.1 type I-E CRISPR-associated protein Cas7/Cse4/CasC [Propionimicrobium lymphophilum]